MRREERLNDPEESFRLAFEGEQSKIWTAIPAIVSSVNLANQTISCTPAIQAKETDENGVIKNITLPQLINVPIIFPKGGGFSLTFPVKENDEVLVIFSCRSIDSWWQNGGVGSQVEVRMHDLSDGFAIFSPTSQPKKLNSISENSVQLRDDSGDTFVEIGANSSIKIQASTIEITGDITHTGSLTSSGIIYATHKHTDVQSGGDISGEPIN